MSYSRSFAPSSGYSGHIPGEKWQVGKSQTNAFLSQVEQRNVVSAPRLEISHVSAAEGSATDGNEPVSAASGPRKPQTFAGGEFIEMVNAISEHEAHSRMTSDGAHRLESTAELRSAGMQSYRSENAEIPYSRNSNREVPVHTVPNSVDFERKSSRGAASISSGRVTPHRESIKTGISTVGSCSGSQCTPQKSFSCVPIPGYSGHMPGMRDREVGKNFTTAAKECYEGYAGNYGHQ